MIWRLFGCREASALHVNPRRGTVSYKKVKEGKHKSVEVTTLKRTTVNAETDNSQHARPDPNPNGEGQGVPAPAAAASASPTRKWQERSRARAPAVKAKQGELDDVAGPDGDATAVYVLSI